MNRIRLLPSEVFNKIAAGEVVERAASVVKELVENSIDGESSEISIEINVKDDNHSIFISDNGHGIERDSIPYVFLPHATSKIENAEDLNSILTLGFRGEALASIAAVSRVTMTTRTRNDETATTILIEGGEIIRTTEDAGDIGTTFLVENLFYNTPARKKFLKKTPSETAEITSVIAKLILANPKVGIKYVLNGKQVFNSGGNGFKNSIFTVYGAETVKNCLEADCILKDCHVTGFVGKSDYFKANSTYQTFIVNGRYVSNSTLASAVKNAYRAFMLPRMFPFVALIISLPADELDVNVHPNKLDVRFYDSQKIYLAVYNAINEALKIHSKQMIEEYTLSLYPAKSTSGIEPDVCFNENKDTFKKIEVDERHRPPVERFTLNQAEEVLFNNLPINRPLIVKEMQVSQGTFGLESETISCKIIGRLFNTYLLLENNKTEEFMLIDQHAAHERILFDLLMTEAEKSGKCIVQPLLVPYVFEVNSSEANFISANLQDLEIIGFLIQPFGNNTFKLDAVPAILAEIDLQAFKITLLEDLNKEKISQMDFNYQILARKACRAAVKANDKLSDGDVKTILEKITKNNALTCPHGRPIVVTIRKSEIEKWFKRKL